MIVLDARPKLNATVNKLFGGGGFESMKHYKNCELEFCGIENIHEVRKSFQKFSDIRKSYTNFNCSNF